MKNVEAFANRVVNECESTNDLAKALAEIGYPHGTWVSSIRQTRGRGRGGNSWISLPGNLFLSVVIRNLPEADWPSFPIVVGEAIVGLIKEIEPNLVIAIKHPNDLLINGEKVCGILCESSYLHKYVVVGIGLNCDSAPEGLDQPVTYLKKHVRYEGASLVDHLRKRIVEHFL